MANIGKVRRRHAVPIDGWLVVSIVILGTVSFLLSAIVSHTRQNHKVLYLSSVFAFSTHLYHAAGHVYSTSASS